MVETGDAGCDPDIWNVFYCFVAHVFRGGAAVRKGSATNGGAARRYAWISIAAAVITNGLKLAA